jgi:hypothetical protein
MTYKVYLDDIRNPKSEGWVVARNVEQFKSLILERGLPCAISFDHDLGLDEPTGYDAAKWLVEYLLEHGLDLQGVEINVHSANPVGKVNIVGLIHSFNKFTRET